MSPAPNPQVVPLSRLFPREVMLPLQLPPIVIGEDSIQEGSLALVAL